MARLEQLRGEPANRGEAFSFVWNGQEIIAFPGETILGALVAAGVRELRRTERGGTPRGMLCGIGVCFDCLVTVDGVPDRRACVTFATPGMCVQSGQPSVVTADGGSGNE